MKLQNMEFLRNITTTTDILPEPQAVAASPVSKPIGYNAAEMTNNDAEESILLSTGKLQTQTESLFLMDQKLYQL